MNALLVLLSLALAFGVAAGGMLFQILVKLMDRVRNSIPE